MVRVRHCVFVAIAASVVCPATASAQITWSGTSADGNWSSVGAFVGSSGAVTLANNFNRELRFAGTSLLSSTNTFVGGTTSNITFLAGAGAFTIGGQPLTLTGGIANDSENLQTIALNVVLRGNSTVSGTSVTLSGTLTQEAGNRIITNNVTSGGLLALGAVNLSNSDTGYTLTLQGSGHTQISGAISNGGAAAGSLALGGSGTISLLAASTYSGTTAINTGQTPALVLGHNEALGTSVVTIPGNNTVFTLSASTDLTGVANTIRLSGANAFFVSGTNSINLSGEFINLVNGVIGNNVGAGKTLTLSGTTSIRDSTATTANRTLTLSGTGNTTFSGPIIDGGSGSGTSTLAINNTGVTTLSAANTYTGQTSVNGGVVVLENASAVPGGIGASGGESFLRINGGVIGLTAASGDMLRPVGGGMNQVTIGGAGGGFAAFGGTRVVDFGGTGGSVTWGGTPFFSTGTGPLVLGSAGADGTLDFRNAIALGTAANTRTFQVDDGAAKVDAILSGVLSGAAQVRKTGLGTLLLSASNTYTGATTVTAGRLEIAPTGRINTSSEITIDGPAAELRYNASTPLTSAITFTQGTISGTGTIGTAVTAAANTALSPGNSPGNQPYAAGLTLATSGTYVWEINDAIGSKGVQWDLITVSGGSLDLAGLSSEGKFNLVLVTLSGTTPGSMANYTAGDPGRWRIFDATSLVLPSSFDIYLVSGTYTPDTDVTSLFTLDPTGWQNGSLDPANVTVLVAVDGTGLDLVIVPEPAAWALAALGIGGTALRFRRRQGDR